MGMAHIPSLKPRTVRIPNPLLRSVIYRIGRNYVTRRILHTTIDKHLSRENKRLDRSEVNALRYALTQKFGKSGLPREPISQEQMLKRMPPELLFTCKSRIERKQVLFAEGRAGSGTGTKKKPEYTDKSYIRCERRS